MRRIAAGASIAATIVVSVWLIAEPFLHETSTSGWGSELASWIGVVALIAGLGVLGGLVAWHRPDETMGRLLLAFALAFGFRSTGEAYVIDAFVPPASSAVRWAVFVDGLLIALSTGLLVTLAVVFPSGRPAGSRWKRALVVVWASAGAMALTAPFVPYVGGTEQDPVVISSLFPSVLTVDAANALSFLVPLPMIVVLFAAVVRLVRIGVRGSSTERLQMRWLAYTLVLVAILLAIASVLPASAAIAGLIAAFGITASIGIAITRYRLYDIDRVISRTVAYAVVLGILTLLFIGIASIPTFVLDGSVTPAWVIAASTLLVFSLFNPLRRRVQRTVDRRFHRLPYDPEGVLAQLARDLREDVEIDSIAAAMRVAASEALQPSTSHVWVRG